LGTLKTYAKINVSEEMVFSDLFRLEYREKIFNVSVDTHNANLSTRMKITSRVAIQRNAYNPNPVMDLIGNV